MAIQFEDLLAVMCPGFELKHATDFQKNFSVADEKAAKLAFDVLVSFGFDAKVYRDEENNSSKLYITLPAADINPQFVEQRLQSALAYGKALKDIKDRMDTLCRDDATVLQSPSYVLTFTNAPQGKQLLVGINSAAAVNTPLQPVQPQRPAAQPAQANRPVATKPAGKKGAKKEDDGFNQGPSIAKQLYGKEEGSEDDLRRRIFLYVTGNMATGGAGMMAAIIVMFVLFSFFVLAKGFLCPDFAVEKKNVNRAWYCEDPNKKQEDPNKPKLPELPTQGNIR